jgi:hypothetical protein
MGPLYVSKLMSIDLIEQILIIVIVAFCVFGGYYLYQYYNKKQKILKKKQKAIHDEYTLPSNEYVVVNMKAFRKNEANFLRFGIASKGMNEDYRHYYKRANQILPNSKEESKNFLFCIEETLYSDKPIGEHERDRAIEAVRRVQFTLEKFVLTEQQLKILQETYNKSQDPEVVSYIDRLSDPVKITLASIQDGSTTKFQTSFPELEKLFDKSQEGPLEVIPDSKSIYISPSVRIYFIRVIQSLAAHGFFSYEPKINQIQSVINLAKTKAREAGRTFMAPEDCIDALIDGAISTFTYTNRLDTSKGVGPDKAILFIASKIHVPGHQNILNY